MSPEHVALERELRALSAELAWPDAPDVASGRSQPDRGGAAA